MDEADVVKTDGAGIYLLHGGQFLIVDSWPATNLAMATSVAVEGEPIEMFVANGQAVVFSRVDGTHIYAAAQRTQRPAYSDAYSPGSYYGGGLGAATTGVAIGPPGSVGGGYGFPGYGSELAIRARRERGLRARHDDRAAQRSAARGRQTQ